MVANEAGEISYKKKGGVMLRLFRRTKAIQTDSEPRVAYSASYGGVRPIQDQVSCLQNIFYGVGPADLNVAKRPLPVGAEGYFAFPYWKCVAPTYGEAVGVVLAELAKVRLFFNNDAMQALARKLEPMERTACCMLDIRVQQERHDILIVPAQFGRLHSGKSVEQTRRDFINGEFGLGAFETGVMLLSHPDRLASWDDLDIDCPGDRFIPEPAWYDLALNDPYDRAPPTCAPSWYYDGYDEVLHLNEENDARVGNARRGSASAFHMAA